MLKRTLLSLTFCTLWLTCGCGPTSVNAPQSSGHVRADATNLTVPKTAQVSESAAEPSLLQLADATDSEPGGIQLASADGNVDPQKKKDEELVTARVLLEYDKLPAGDICRGLILLNVKAGWHINTNPAKPDFLIPTTVSLKSKQKTEMSDVRYPKGKDL